MIRSLCVLFVVFFLSVTLSVAQNNQGVIKITLADKKNTAEKLPFASVVVYQGKAQVAVGTTNIDGEVYIRQLPAGKYNIKAVYVGYQPQQINDVLVMNDKTIYLNILLANEGVKLDEVEVTEYAVPIIDPDTKSGGTVTREQFQHMAQKELGAVVSTQAGVYQSDAGASFNVRGSRSGGTNVFIDGERAIGTTTIPQQAVEQMSVILGGLPAQYGDVTGGVVSITTRGPQPKLFGGVEAISSQLTDKYGYNFIGFSVGGPMIKGKKKDSADVPKPIVGFFLGGEATYFKDPSPWANGIYQVSPSKLASFQQTPLTFNQQSGIYLPAAAYLTSNDMYLSAVRPNVGQTAIRLNPKFDIAINKNLNLTIGGSWEYLKYSSFVYDYALLNAQHNPQTIQNTKRVYARLTQRFGSDKAEEQEKSQAIFKRAYLTMQAGYQSYVTTVQDAQFTNNYFDYGFVGQFTEYQMPNYIATNSPVSVHGQVINGGQVPVYQFAGYTDSLIKFNSANSQNPLASNYTNEVVNGLTANGTKIFNYAQIYQNNGLRNGDRPTYVQSLWLPTGRPYGGFSVTNNSIFRFTTSFSAEVKNHSITMGIEYDQRNERGYSINTSSLWGQMRQLANMHNTQVDTSQMSWNTNTTHSVSVVNFNPYGPNTTDNTLGVVGPSTPFDPNSPYAAGILYNGAQESVFAKNFYDQVLHDPYNSTRYINVDAYTPQTFNLGMFSPDELLNSGSPIAYAYGYDYSGNKLAGNGKASFTDFLTKFHMDKFNDTIHNRQMGAFQPVYMAGYIQDKFDFKNIKFNVGLRVDRYDANQMVLKDKYLLKDAYHASDLSSLGASAAPSGIPSDAVVYVDNNNVGQTKNVVGYRSGDTWYDPQGNVINDPKIIQDGGGGQAQPWLVNSTDKSPYSNSAFTSYKPIINVMPRIAFSFPISDVANFFAHYDILTQRPLDLYSRLDPTNYYFMSANQGAILNNPDLKPQRTVDYELGFSQLLNQKKNAGLKLSAFYREMRNLVQIQRVNQAYPLSYITYGNMDFATVKGFSAEFTLRRTGGFQLNINYTLQFAEGSGSNANGGYNLASTNQPNLRVILPLSFDQRHTLATTLDYRFGAGTNYRGPQTERKNGKKPIMWLEDFGINLVPRVGSGTPYTRRIPAKADEEVGNNITQQIAGDLNGSRFPWQFRTDMRIDKNFQLDRKNGRGNKNLNVYLQVLNLFNTKNIINVHNYTGSPKDDGYLASNLGIVEINQAAALGALYQQAFVSQYNAKLNDGTYYSMPRMVRIGVQFDF